MNSRWKSEQDSTSCWRKCNATGSVGQSGGRSVSAASGTNEKTKRIEGRPQLSETVDVVGNRVPEEEFLPGRVEELVAELDGGVRKERRDEHAFCSTETHSGRVVGVKRPQAAAFELAAAAALARVVAAGC